MRIILDESSWLAFHSWCSGRFHRPLNNLLSRATDFLLHSRWCSGSLLSLSPMSVSLWHTTYIATGIDSTLIPSSRSAMTETIHGATRHEWRHSFGMRPPRLRSWNLRQSRISSCLAHAYVSPLLICFVQLLAIGQTVSLPTANLDAKRRTPTWRR